MKIYTSYFAQIRNFPPNLVGLSTAVWNPKWLPKDKSQNGIIWLDIPPLKPGKNCEGLCNGKCNPKHPSDCAFLRAYEKQLNSLNYEEIVQKLDLLAHKIEKEENLSHVNFALIVYETPNNPCSERIVIQKWFKSHGMEIEEWKKEKTIIDG